MKAVTASGRIVAVGSASDWLLLVSYISLVGAGFSVLGVLAIWALLLFMAGTYQALLTLLLRVQPLPRQRLDRILPLILDVKRSLHLWRRPRVYWVPTELRVGARVLGWVFPMLVISAGFAVLLDKGDTRARPLLAHELAHLRNGDTLLFTLLTIIAFNLCLTVASPTNVWTNVWLATSIDVNQLNPIERWGGWAAGMLIGAAVQLAVFFWWLRRREFYADALAVNAVLDASAYSRLLQDPTTQHSMWLHPPAQKRLDALTKSSPVLRASTLELILATLFVFGAWHRYGAGNVFLWAQFVAIVLLILSKGFSRKRPASRTEILQGSATLNA